VYNGDRVLPRVCLLLMVGGLTAFAESGDLAATATSPYELARYIETHNGFDWGPLWKVLGIRDESVFLQPCEEAFRGVAGCSSELITVVDPLQVIVLLQSRPWESQVFLRYESAGVGRWRFAGAYAPFAKYFRPEHRIVRFGAKPYLIVTGQGNAGTGLSSKLESWIDLTANEFKPVLEFTSEGDKLPWPEGIGRTVHGIVTSLETRPVERVAVSMNIEFEAVQDGGDKIALGGRRDRVVYVRKGTAGFEPEPSLSTATVKEVGVFYDDLDSDLGDGAFLRFNHGGLVALAKSKDEGGRSWLARFLQRCPDGVESRELKALLAGPH